MKQEAQRLMAECCFYRIAYEHWKVIYNKSPHLAMQALVRWSRHFEIIGVQYEPYFNNLTGDTIWLL